MNRQMGSRQSSVEAAVTYMLSQQKNRELREIVGKLLAMIEDGKQEKTGKA